MSCHTWLLIVTKFNVICSRRVCFFRVLSNVFPAEVGTKTIDLIFVMSKDEHQVLCFKSLLSSTKCMCLGLTYLERASVKSGTTVCSTHYFNHLFSNNLFDEIDSLRIGFEDFPEYI